MLAANQVVCVLYKCICVYVGFVVDQTPTPTRFLKSCEEVGLFQEISPFDKDFKKAVEQQQNDEVCTCLSSVIVIACSAAVTQAYICLVNLLTLLLK